MARNAFELPRVGSTFAGQFEVLELIGQGGMGIVYRARQLKLQREVALKVLRPSAVADGYEEFRLEREAVSAARFRSQHVVDIYDWGMSPDGLTYLVMELLHGETLAQRLDRQGRVEPAQVLAWLRQCSEALDEASALGLVHRDIKPANIFLATTPVSGTTEIKILDFGITKVFDSTRATFSHEATSQSSLRLGTTRYMSPEQLRATSTVDSRADIWSLGVVIYQALSGRLPFDRESEADLIVSILSDEPAPLHVVNPRLSRPVANAVARALEKSAVARYRSAGEFSRALAAALARHPPSPEEHGAKSVRAVPPPAAHPSANSVETVAGLETKASNDSLRAERKKSQLSGSKVLTIAGAAFALSSAVVFAGAAFIPASSTSEAPPTGGRVVPKATGHESEHRNPSTQFDNAPLPSASAPGPAASITRPPTPRFLGGGSTKPKHPQAGVATRAPAPPAVSAPAPPSAPQFMRDNPYAN
jgi:serine/threonine protein kinase